MGSRWRRYSLRSEIDLKLSGFLRHNVSGGSKRKKGSQMFLASLDVIEAFGHRLTHPAIPGRLLLSRAYFRFTG